MDAEKTMQFLLEQQARFDARQAELQARQAEFDACQTQLQAQFAAHQARFDEDMSRVNAVLLNLATSQERTNEILATLAERHVELERSHTELTEAQKVTEQNLNALIVTVERHIADHK